MQAVYFVFQKDHNILDHGLSTMAMAMVLEKDATDVAGSTVAVERKEASITAAAAALLQNQRTLTVVQRYAAYFVFVLRE